MMNGVVSRLILRLIYAAIYSAFFLLRPSCIFFRTDTSAAMVSNLMMFLFIHYVKGSGTFTSVIRLRQRSPSQHLSNLIV